MAVDPVAESPWNHRPDDDGITGRIAWNAQQRHHLGNAASSTASRLHPAPLDAIEALATEPRAKGYRPKDTYLGRVYDLIDWVKGVLSM